MRYAGWIYDQISYSQLPIRRRSHPNPSRTIELVKRELEAFALVFPNVSFSLENTRRDQEGTLGRSKARVLTVPKVCVHTFLEYATI